MKAWCNGSMAGSNPADTRSNRSSLCQINYNYIVVEYKKYKEELLNIMAYIYKITNDINDKVYIGKTVYTVEQRWR